MKKSIAIDFRESKFIYFTSIFSLLYSIALIIIGIFYINAIESILDWGFYLLPIREILFVPTILLLAMGFFGSIYYLIKRKFEVLKMFIPLFVNSLFIFYFFVQLSSSTRDFIIIPALFLLVTNHKFKILKNIAHYWTIIFFINLIYFYVYWINLGFFPRI